MRKVWFFAAVLLVLGASAACGEGDLGEECGEEGKVDGECDDGLVCSKKNDTSSDLACLKQCSSQAECAGNEDCNGVSNSALKACRPKNGTQSSSSK